MIEKHNRLVFEGVDGVGKTTQAQLLVNALHADGKSAKYLKSPVGSMRGENIWKIMQSYHFGSDEEAVWFLLRDACFYRDVMVVVEEQSNNVTVLDRWSGSFLNYFHALKGMALSDLVRVFELWVEPVTTRQVVLLDAPVEQIQLRLEQKAVKSRFDSATQDVLERQRQGYLELADIFGWTVVNATGSISEVYTKVHSQVSI